MERSHHPQRVVVSRHTYGVEEHSVGDLFPRAFIAKKVETGLQLRYSPISEEVGEDVAGT